MSKFEFNGKAIFLTYKTHLSEEVLLNLFKGDALFDAVHETSDKEHKYDHTHVLVYYNRKTHIRNCRHWDIYPNTPKEIHPHVKVVKTKKHWQNLTNYIRKQNKPFIEQLTGNEYEWLGSVRTIIQSHKCWRDVINDDYLTKYIMGYMSWAKEVWAARPKRKCLLKKLRPWQQEVYDRLHKYKEEKNDRKVIWIFDPDGSSGKTKLFKHLISEGAMGIAGGRIQDNAYKFNYEDIVAFNLVKTQEGYTPYKQIECFKDGYIESPKYMSEAKMWDTSQVIVFANYYPIKSALIADRWDIGHIKAGEISWENDKVVPEVLNIKRTSRVEKEKTSENKKEKTSENKKEKTSERKNNLKKIQKKYMEQLLFELDINDEGENPYLIGSALPIEKDKIS